MFNLTTERIEAEVALDLFNHFKARVWISAGYRHSLSETRFSAKFTIETGLDVLSNKTAEFLINTTRVVRNSLQRARQSVREAKTSCEKSAESFCHACKNIACDEISEECERSMDNHKLKHFVGEEVDKLGEKSILYYSYDNDKII